MTDNATSLTLTVTRDGDTVYIRELRADGENYYDETLREAIAQAIRRVPNMDAPQWIGPEAVLHEVEQFLGRLTAT